MKKNHKKTLREHVWEKNNALEGVFWPLKKRFQVLNELYQTYWFLTPFRYPKPFVKSFSSFKEYETWKKKQKNPWYW